MKKLTLPTQTVPRYTDGGTEPQIIIQGTWLTDYGFEVDQPLQVEVLPGTITVLAKGNSPKDNKYAPLEAYFSDMCSPSEASSHLGKLLYSWSYLHSKGDGLPGFFETYWGIFELQLALEELAKHSGAWK